MAIHRKYFFENERHLWNSLYPQPKNIVPLLLFVETFQRILKISYIPLFKVMNISRIDTSTLVQRVTTFLWTRHAIIRIKVNILT